MFQVCDADLGGRVVVMPEVDQSAVDGLLQLLLGAVISGGVAAAVLGLIFHRWTKSVEAQISSRLNWKEDCVREVLGPMRVHLGRTKQAFESNWGPHDEYIQTEVIKKSNETMRDILMDNGHLVPKNLFVHALRLVAHYDAWLQEYARQYAIADPEKRSAFVFAGPKGFAFPRDSECAFLTSFEIYARELYGDAWERGELGPLR
jgi:hypothetical protein